jgi:hypothetical protein
MSEQTPAPAPAPEPALAQAELKRRAREAKAVAKANRSWFARHKLLTALGVLAVLVVGISLASGGDGDAPAAGAGTSPSAPAATEDAAPEATAPETTAPETTAAGPAEDAAPAEPAAAGIGQPVRDGKFEFTVTSVEPGVARVGNEFLNKTAQGQFVLVHLTVTNIGDEAQYLFGDNQYAYDSAGRRFSADSEAGIYLEESASFINEINPGNTVEGIVVFDVPTDVTLTSLELHDSAFSGGVTVALG